MRHQGNPSKLFSFNIAVTLTVGFVSLVSSAILILGYALTKDNDTKNKNLLTFAVATLSASATITGTFYVGQSIKQSAESQEIDRKLAIESQKIDRKLAIESQKIDRTLLYIQRWNDSHYSSFKKLAYQIHLLIDNKPDNQKEKIVREEIEKDADLRMEVTEFLNFLEEMALCVNRELIIEELSRDFYRSIVIQYYNIFGVWIAQLRTHKKEDKLYKELTALFEKWKAL